MFFVSFTCQVDRMEKECLLTLCSEPNYVEPYLPFNDGKPSEPSSGQIHETYIKCLNAMESEYASSLVQLKRMHEEVGMPSPLILVERACCERFLFCMFSENWRTRSNQKTHGCSKRAACCIRSWWTCPRKVKMFSWSQDGVLWQITDSSNVDL